MAQKSGVDRVTQVDENDPELFNFNYEVQPIIDVFFLLLRLFSIKLLKLVEWNCIKKGKCGKKRNKS